jgi:hypothetical protein
MMHLFNNVFLEQDFMLEVFTKVVVISSEYNTDMKLNPNCLYCGDTLEDVLGDKTLEQFLREMITKEEKVVIFANNDAFSKIATAWLKSSTKMDAASFESWASCYKFKCDVYSRPNAQLFELLKANWSTAPAYDFSDSAFTPSFEFGLASAFYNRDFAKKEQFKGLLSKFIKREYEQQILEARKHLDTHILDKDLQVVLGGSGKTLENFKELPRMSIYREPFFRETVDTVPPNQSYWPGKVGKIDISRASESELEELCTLSDDINIALSGISNPAGLSGIVNSNFSLQSRGWKFINTVKAGVLSDVEYNEALDEMLAESITLVHVPFDLRETILFVFLPYIKSLKQENNTTALEKFTLK